MEKIKKKSTGRSSQLPKKTTLVSPAETVHSDDVEKVLEHVSSPFRWELLEVPAAQPKISMPKRSTHHKSRST
jgi:hypothetical protein